MLQVTLARPSDQKSSVTLKKLEQQINLNINYYFEIGLSNNPHSWHILKRGVKIETFLNLEIQCQSIF